MNPQQIAALKNDLLTDKFSKALSTQMFPVENLSCNWKHTGLLALKNTSPLKSRISLAEFAKVVKADPYESLTLFQFGIMSNAIEEMSVTDIGGDPDYYIEVAIEASEHIKYYNSQIKIIQERIQKEVEEEVKLRLAVSENGGILKPIKGEA